MEDDCIPFMTPAEHGSSIINQTLFYLNWFWLGDLRLNLFGLKIDDDK